MKSSTPKPERAPHALDTVTLCMVAITVGAFLLVAAYLVAGERARLANECAAIGGIYVSEHEMCFRRDAVLRMEKEEYRKRQAKLAIP